MFHRDIIVPIGDIHPLFPGVLILTSSVYVYPSQLSIHVLLYN
jgi:hypothetical protein